MKKRQSYFYGLFSKICRYILEVCVEFDILRTHETALIYRNVPKVSSQNPGLIGFTILSFPGMYYKLLETVMNAIFSPCGLLCQDGNYEI
jgi:hypothetical protein